MLDAFFSAQGPPQGLAIQSDNLLARRLAHALFKASNGERIAAKTIKAFQIANFTRTGWQKAVCKRI
jgi:hypothetical protein